MKNLISRIIPIAVIATLGVSGTLVGTAAAVPPRYRAAARTWRVARAHAKLKRKLTTARWVRFRSALHGALRVLPTNRATLVRLEAAIWKWIMNNTGWKPPRIVTNRIPGVVDRIDPRGPAGAVRLRRGALQRLGRLGR